MTENKEFERQVRKRVLDIISRFSGKWDDSDLDEYLKTNIDSSITRMARLQTADAWNGGNGSHVEFNNTALENYVAGYLYAKTGKEQYKR